MSKKPTFTTAIEWHDAKTDPPKESGRYLSVTKHGTISNVDYSAKHNRFNFFDYDDPAERDVYPAVLWAEIPEQFTWDALAPYREGDGV